MDDIYFKKIFRYPVEIKQNFELFNKKCFVDPQLQHWLNFKNRYNFYFTKIKPYRLNPQAEYFAARFSFTKYKKILSSPMTGLSVLGALRTEIQKEHEIIFNRLSKVMQLCADISVNNVSNPIFYIQGIERVHPGKNLVSAHQILGKQLKVIVGVEKNEIPNISCDKKLNNLKDIANCFENMPIGFIEPTHLHLFCFHEGYNGFDSNGYVVQPSYDLDSFLEFLSSYNGLERIDIKKSNGSKINIPIIYDTNEINKIFQEAYRQDFRWRQ